MIDSPNFVERYSLPYYCIGLIWEHYCSCGLTYGLIVVYITYSLTVVHITYGLIVVYITYGLVL